MVYFGLRYFRASLVFILLACWLTTNNGVLAAPLSLYVSPNGNDSWSGILPKANAKHTDGPFATLEAARDRLRALTARSKGGITVWIEGGSYSRTTPFTLAQQDSGSLECPIVYRAQVGERVTITGGRSVSGWKHISAPAVLGRLDSLAAGHVLVVDLAAQRITDYGDLSRRGFGQASVPSGLKLFFEGQPMTLAQWPKLG